MKATKRRALKRPFDIRVTIRRRLEALRPLPRAAMFQLAEEGHSSVFELHVACIISIRTRDETTVLVARQIFVKASSPAEMARLTPRQIDVLIGACTFHEAKARQIHEIARRALQE